MTKRSYPDEIAIDPLGRSVNLSIRPPGSKSLTNRALVCAALASGTSRLSGALFSDDTRVMIESLTRLGFDVESDLTTSSIVVAGHGGTIPNRTAKLDIENSGTTVRFLTAMLGMAGGDYVIDGVERMRQRPIGPLVDALNAWGANVNTQSPGQCPPVTIGPMGDPGYEIRVSGDISSQYLSGLMMAAPLRDHDVRIIIDGPLISKPYVAMTARVMADFGAAPDALPNDTGYFVSREQQYVATDYAIEPDASAASYFLASAAICGGTVTIEGLHQNALQGDVQFANALELMGCEVEWGGDSVSVTGPAKVGVDIDMADISDTVQTLAPVALFVNGPTTVRNVAHNRVKETDRIGNLVIELRKLGIQVDEQPDGLTIHPGPMTPARFATYDDHRMAMGFSLIGLRHPGIVIENPGCVSKTYPGFFDDLAKL